MNKRVENLLNKVDNIEKIVSPEGKDQEQPGEPTKDSQKSKVSKSNW